MATDYASYKAIIESGTSIKISATQASSSTSITVAAPNNALRIRSIGASEAFIRVGNGSQTAVVDSDFYIHPDTVEILFLDTNVPSLEVGAICNTGETATIYVSPVQIVG